MYYIITPIVIIVIALLIILTIIIKKFSVLASLDLETIPAEKEAKFKEQIVNTRLERNLGKFTSRLTVVFKFIKNTVASFTTMLHDKLSEMKNNYSSQEDRDMTVEEKGEKSKEILSSIDDMDEKEDFTEIENKLITAISLDSKNPDSFEELGWLYHKNKKMSESRQAFEHALKLLGDEETDRQADIYFDLSLVHRDSDNNEEALNTIKKAVKLAPNNPRFLDIMLEMCILNKDKETAVDVFNKLSEVNPENQKLAELEEKLKSL